MEAELLFRIVAFAVLMFMSACFSASETAFFSLSRHRVRVMRHEGRAERRVAGLLDRPRRLIISILMGNEMVNIASSAIFTAAVVLLWDEQHVWMAPVIMTPLLMVFGEITPKSIAARFPEALARLLVYPLSLFAKLIFPLRWVFLQISNFVLTFLGAPPRARTNIVMEDEFLSLVDAGLAEGELDPTESAYIHNIFEFHDRTVGDITIPRTDMVCLEESQPLGGIIEFVRNAPHSRLPIFRGDRDTIVGVLYVKDFLRLARQREIEPDERIKEHMMRAPIFVPSGMKLDALFRLFRNRRTHIAIVADEHGGVVGLVTMKDLLEEIFGEIHDEHDAPHEAVLTERPDGSFDCLARLPLWEFTERTGWPLPDAVPPNVTTVGGLVFNMLGHVPKRDEKVRCGDVLFTVVEARRTRVIRVRVERVEETG